MKRFAPILAALTIVSLLPGCGGGSGVRFGDLFDESAAAEGTGVQFTGVVRAVVILATHDATTRQRQVAEQNGRRAIAQLQARWAARPSAATPAGRQKQTAATAATARHSPKSRPLAAAEPEPDAPQAPGKPRTSPKLPRIIAIPTEKDEHTDKKAAKAVMLFDTHAQTIIGNKVYDIEREPRSGDDVRFETYSASYIGASL